MALFNRTNQIGGFGLGQPMTAPNQAVGMPALLGGQPTPMPAITQPTDGVKPSLLRTVIGSLADGLAVYGRAAPVFGPGMDALQEKVDQERKWQSQLAQQAQLERERMSAPTADQRNLAWYQSLTPEAQDSYNKMHRGDPTVTLTLPGDRGIYSGPQSGLGSALQGLAGGPKAGPKPGDVDGGYQFMGGNPADPKSWKPVGGASGNAGGGFR